jgi:alpha-L-rhamnosidase
VRRTLTLAVAVALLAPGAARAEIAVTGLEADAAPRLLGTDNPHPRLSWRLRADRTGVGQRAYRILVATSPERLAPGRADLWDSGRVRGSRAWADYAGRRLPERTRAHWTVRVWDERGAPTAWARPAWLETALRDWTARWIAGAPRTPTEGPAGLVDDAEMTAAGEFCRPVGTPGPLTLVGGPQRDEYLSRMAGACRAVRPAPLLRREFAVDGAVRRARLYVSGLGYADVHLNGRQLGDGAVLDPGYTDYAKTALFVTYDVTDRLRRGANALGVELGSGFYDYDVTSEWSWTQADWRGDPRLRAELHLDYADGRTAVVRSDESWLTRDGPTRYDNINAGETYDARFARDGWDRPGFDAAGWGRARVVDPPAGRLAAQVHEPIAIVGRRRPRAVSEPRPGVRVYDLGEQLTGWAELAIAAPAGQAAEITYGETLAPDGTVDTSHNLHVGERLQTDFLVAGPDGRARWRPRFSYKGFRYVQVAGPRQTPFTGAVTGVEAQVVRSDVRPTATFSTDNALVDQIHGLVAEAIPNNLHGIVTDTPVYEKNGWTGDAQITAPTAATLYDLRRFYRKWLRDIRDSQARDGEIPVIVPSGEQYGYTDVGWDAAWGPTPAWDAAMFLIPWEVHDRYGDDRLLRETYPAMRRYLDDHLAPAAQGHLLDSGLGDHLSPSSTDGIGLIGAAGLTKLVSTAYYAEFLRRTADVAALVDDAEGEARYRRLHAEVRAAFNAAFLDPAAGRYREDPDSDEVLQTAQVLPLAFGLVPAEHRARVARTAADDVAAGGGNLDTGIVGTRYVLEQLTEMGYADVAFGIATQTDKPSWGEWVRLGYTSLPENWGASIRSLDHHMFGSIGQWFYEDLAGVEPLRPGYEEIEFRPTVPSRGLNAVDFALRTVRGRVATSWRRSGDRFTLTATVPAGARGVVRLPSGDATAPPGARRVASGAYRVGSGTWRFAVAR